MSQRIMEVPEMSEVRDALDVRWAALASAVGFVPLPVPSGVAAEAWLEGIDISGLVLTGGNELPETSRASVDIRRDATDRALLTHAMACGWGVVGVCRGAQMIASAFGGQVEARVGHVRTRHSIVWVRPVDRMAEPKEVNSFHNFVITSLGPELETVGLAPDGSIEAFKHRSMPIFGILWHPEREEPFDFGDLRLLREVLLES
jgi:putative glutamine amidotransferase